MRLRPLILAALLASPAAAQADGGLYVPLNDFALVSSGSANVRLNGNLVLTEPQFTLNVVTNPNGKPVSIAMSTTVNGGVTVECSADLAGSFDESIPVAYLLLSPIQLTSQVTVIPALSIYAEFAGNAAAGMRASLVQEFEVPVSIALGPGIAPRAGTPPLVSVCGPPDLGLGTSASLEVGLSTRIEFHTIVGGFYIGAPLAGAESALTFAIDAAADPWWTLDGDFVPFVGYMYGPFEKRVDFPGVPFHIADAGGPLPALPPATRWSEAFDFSSFEVLTAVRPTAGGLLVAGQTEGNRAWLANLADDGAVVSELRADMWGSVLPIEALPMADGSTVLVGTDNNGVRIERINPDGTLRSGQLRSHPTSGLSVAAAVDTLDGGYAIVGTATVASPVSSRAYIAQFEINDYLVWMREIDLGASVTSSEGLALTRTADGDLVVGGFASFLEYDSASNLVLNGENVLLARFTSGGILEWASCAGTIATECAVSVSAAADGTLTAASMLSEGGSNYPGLFVFEADGTLRRATAYVGDLVGLVDYRPVDVQPVEGGTLMSGWVADNVGPNGFEAWMALVSDDGFPLWWKTVAGAAHDLPHGLCVLDDGLAVSGSTFSPDALGSGTMEDLWLLRTSVDGMLHFKADSGMSMRNDLVDWWTRHDVVTATTIAAVAIPVSLTTAPVVPAYAASAANVQLLTE